MTQESWTGKQKPSIDLHVCVYWYRLEEAKLEEQKIADDRQLLEMRLKHEVDKVKVNEIYLSACDLVSVKSGWCLSIAIKLHSVYSNLIKMLKF